jgi:general stress protein 26
MEEKNDITVLKEKVSDVRICMFTTLDLSGHLSSRPMATAKVEDDGSIWFFSNEYSLKSKEISKDNEVLLSYSNPSSNTYIYVNGVAELVDDDARKREYFMAPVKVWFPKGVDDPALTLIKVTPKVAEYWDGSSSKMVVAYQMIKAIITGEKGDMGEHDKIEFNS